MTKCDRCNVPVSSTGYLGGGIVCHDCAEDKRKDNWDKIEARRNKYGYYE